MWQSAPCVAVAQGFNAADAGLDAADRCRKLVRELQPVAANCNEVQPTGEVEQWNHTQKKSEEPPTQKF